jgi:hypothetical protein
MALVLSRAPDQEAAMVQYLADQQNPASESYHHWLTPEEVGERFGPSVQDRNTLISWLNSQGLQVNWISPSGMFVNFNGSAANVERAFHTELHHYTVRGQQRYSVSSDPSIPVALSPVIRAIRGLSSSDDHPLVQSEGGQYAPYVTFNGNHYLSPWDFDEIYDVPTQYTGTGVTIGIVGGSRTNFADFNNFRQLTGSTFANPTEIIPTAYGGVDPGPAYTSPPTNGASTGLQSESTMDVLRAGSVAPGASLLLVVASNAYGANLDADAQYLVQTSPVPAQVMNISFGGCETNYGGGVSFWDTLFQQAAAEGISVFVSSGDAGASGCDEQFGTPPSNPLPNSPNYICSSSYATCVGGTEFADTASPSSYWSSTNNSQLGSVYGYIPEGAWNEPLTSSGAAEAAATGGGVSSYIPTPSWQTGTGVPAARTGRYTPDVSFSSSAHDGYFGCFAAAGSSCVITGGSYYFEYFFGTSTSSPGMAGVAALLDQKLHGAQGDLNPEIYQLANSVPSVFHDVTVTSSGVTGCSVSVPSMCNNSIPSAIGLTGGQAGYLVTAGYDEATGLGSLDIGNFLANFSALPVLSSVAISPTTISSGSSANLTITLSRAAGSGGASVNLTSSNPSLLPVTSPQVISAGQVAANPSLTAGAASVATPVTITATYNGSSQIATVTVNPVLPTIVFSIPNHTYGDAPFNVTATSNSAGAFTYSVFSGPATISGSTVTLIGAGTVVLQVNQAASGNYAAGVQTASFSVAGNAPTIAFSVANHTYGDPPFALSASSNSPGAFTYSVISGPATVSGFTVTLTGAGAVILEATQASGGGYTLGTQTATFNVAKETQTITFASPASPVAYGVAPTSLSAISSSGLPVTLSVLSGPGSLNNSILTVTGAGMIVVAADQSGNSNYAAASEVTRSITVSKVSPAVSLSASASSVFVSNSLTLTAMVTSSAGAPTGSVVFSDSGVILGSPSLSGGRATLTTSTLAAGAHSISATYSGDANFNSTGSASLSESIVDIALGTTGLSTQTVQGGTVATFNLSVAPSGASTFPAAVSLAASGLPSGFIASFSPSSVASGSSSTSVVLTIQVPTSAMLDPSKESGAPIMVLALLLPFVGFIRRGNQNIRRFAGLLLLSGAGCMALLGCSGGGGGGTGGGTTTTSQPQSYPLIVTATSGALSHTANLTVIVQ